ncbi:SusC/RagA family TonB-linked outer membrane protein [Flavihumibacter fluvii]|uniref:SusC/RagA family TonB-linked outer membrane protein n=1 Tax=Flavihumibacter fluvii TaxID=2838157 RepID=UPI001BDF2AB4|nr:TonB-dependent receptor [Flavihumibacter fluvii]ULQ51565.1 TonB-dependent receptor [Flavihumibacter fluvii]
MNHSFKLHQTIGRRSSNFTMLVALLGLTISVPLYSDAAPKNPVDAPYYADREVTGRITDEKGSPISNVSVVVKGTSVGTTTNDDGFFKIMVPDGKNTLVISYVGFKTTEYPLSSSNNVSIVLRQESGTLSDVVVVGYGTQRKVTVTGAVSAVKGEALVKSPAVDLTNSLAGRLPGLVVIQQSGEPGYDGATVSIRGTNTLGNSSPLVIIDGIPDRDGGLGRLNPKDVESISVLKDASAAIYGARAANGAILVTTKKGSSGKPKITYDFNQGWSQPARIPEMSNAYEYATIMNEIPIYKSIPANEWDAAWESIKTTGSYDSPTPGINTLNANYSPEAVQKHKDGSDPWKYPDTDWFGDAFKTWSPQSRHNLQLTGGNESIRFFTSLGYINQDAYYKNSATRYQQYNFRTNITAKINPYITANIGILARREERNFPTESAGSIFRMLMRGRPTEPEVWPNGKPGPDIENGQNPYVITTNATGYQKNPTDFFQSNGSLDITNPWVKGLKLTLSAAVDKSTTVNKIWQTPWTLYTWDKITYEDDGTTPLLVGSIRSNFTDPRLTQTYGQIINTNLTGMLSYDRKFGEGHTINLLAGVTKEEFKGENFLAFRRNFISPAIAQLFAGGSLGQNTDGGGYNRARLGYYGRAQYNYKEKYLAEFVWRYDGSYMFPEDHRFGFFPGILLGWNMTNEDWFKVKGIDYLKLRASYGQMGNDVVYYNGKLQEYAYTAAYSFGSYPINREVMTTLYEPVVRNQDFTWEVANNYNVGLDGSFFGNKLDVTLEYFYNRRDQILIPLTGATPYSTGFVNRLPPVNGGRVDNRGYEFSFAYNTKIGKDVSIRAGINGGYAKNKVVFASERAGAPEYQLATGKPINAFLVYKSAGVFRDQEDINKNTLDYSGVTTTLIPGDMKFEDVNGDGKINGDDQVRLDKNTIPTFNYGATFELRYKGFDLSLLFQGASGAAIRIQTESGDIGNYLKYFNDHRWSIENPSSTDPRLASRGDTYFTGGGYGNNTYYLFDKDYLRLKNLEIGYNLQPGILQKAKISNFRVFANGLNLFTIDKTKVYDPEATVESGVYYPQPRVINLGFSLTF